MYDPKLYHHHHHHHHITLFLIILILIIIILVLHENTDECATPLYLSNSSRLISSALHANIIIFNVMTTRQVSHHQGSILNIYFLAETL